MAPVLWMALLSTLGVPHAAPAPRIVWIDLAGAPAAAEAAARHEAAELLQEVGIAPEWRVASPHDMVAPGEVAVVLVPRDLSARPGTPRVLGACAARSATPRVWVYLANLGWALGLPSPTGPMSPEQAARVGRAIGRIVAHEVIHAVAPSLSHARSGLMAAQLDRNALLSPHLGVDAVTRRSLRALMAAGLSSGAPRS